jgi:hypothetical protein
VSDSVKFPTEHRAEIIELPVPAEMLQMLEAAKGEFEARTGRQFENVGHFLAWHLWDNEPFGLKNLKGNLDPEDSTLVKFREMNDFE